LVDDAKKLLKSVENRKLLKLSPKFFEEVIAFGQQSNDAELVSSAYALSRAFRTEISLDGFRSLIDSLYQSRGGDKKTNRPNLVLETASKYDLNAEDQVKLSFSQLDRPEDAIQIFERLAGSNLELSGNEFVLANSDLNKEYINQLYAIFADKRAFQSRFNQALKTLKGKYNERAIEKGLESLIQEHEQKIKELRSAAAAAAKETSSNTQTEEAPKEAEQVQEESK